MDKGELKYRELTEMIIGCAMKVHRYFGAGFEEFVYKKAMAIEFRKRGIVFEEEKEFKIFYEDVFIKKKRVDFLVEDLVIVELKAVRETDNGDVRQILNYLKIFTLEVGLLFNFGNINLYFKRYVF